jgi:NagD protein
VNHGEVTLSDLLRNIRHMVLDLDGTIYTDDTVFDSVAPFLAALERLHIGHTFVTNNSSRGKSDYVRRLAGMGIAVEADDIFSSGDATIEYLRGEQPGVRRLFILGTASLHRQFADAGYRLCEDDPDDVPELVVVGFDTGLVYSRFCRAAYWITQGIPYVATHPDRVCPTKQRTVLVDCGSLCAALEHATGRQPAATLGKPNRRMLRGILDRHDLQPAQLAMVGDRLYTDIRMARETGVVGVLVLTGETTAEEAEKCAPPPELIVRDLDELRRRFEASGGANEEDAA